MELVGRLWRACRTAETKQRANGRRQRHTTSHDALSTATDCNAKPGWVTRRYTKAAPRIASLMRWLSSHWTVQQASCRSHTYSPLPVVPGPLAHPKIASPSTNAQLMVEMPHLFKCSKSGACGTLECYLHLVWHCYMSAQARPLLRRQHVVQLD